MADTESNVLQEGKAKIYNEGNKVFYNPAQIVNRDLSVACIFSYRETLRELWDSKEAARVTRAQKRGKEIQAEPWPGMKIFEALSASGLRSIRYFKEIPDVRKIIVNDLDSSAVESIAQNVALNDLSAEQVVPNQGDAIVEMFMRAHKKDFYQVVDLDPYGTAAPFVETAVQAVDDGGLLCVTCTDMQNMAGGKNGGSTFKLHGGMPLKGGNCHEMALRLMIATTAKAAARHKKTVTPLLSLSINFYIRIFFRVDSSPQASNALCMKLSNYHQCPQCGSFELQQLGRSEQKGSNTIYKPALITVNNVCPFCEHRYKLGGPLWNGPIHDKEFVRKVRTHIKDNQADFTESKRLLGMLEMAESELPTALFSSVNDMSRVLKCTQIATKHFYSALLHAGYEVSGTHCNANGFKTTAPFEAIWDILRCWVKKNPISSKHQNERSPGFTILSKEPSLQADFSKHPNLPKKIKNAFMPNPKKFWGPKFRASGKRKLDSTRSVAEELDKRRVDNQGKKKRKLG